MTMFLFSLFLLVLPAYSVRPVPSYVINLDLPGEHLFDEILPDFNESIWEYYNEYFLPEPALVDLFYSISEKRGDENDELMSEIQGIVDITKLPYEFVKSMQLLEEITAMIMPPISNGSQIISEPVYPKGFEGLSKLPNKYGKCSGIIATNSDDGMVYHARNFDNSPVELFQYLVYEASFQSGGVELYKAQMMAGYTMIVTAARFGDNGYGLERNTRFISEWGEAEEVYNNLISGTELQGWTFRTTLQNVDNYDDAVSLLMSAQYTSTEYTIISGVKKGIILAKSPNGVAHTQVLGASDNFEEPEDYIIMTNFDFFYHDVREYFDPTGGGGIQNDGPTRRIAAQTILNNTDVLTPEVLYEVINSKYVLADTVFQVIISIEAGLWNSSIPVPYEPSSSQ